MQREEKRLAKEREKEFRKALKRRVLKTGWKFSGGTIFRQEESWFMANKPSLIRGGGVRQSFQVKPMEMDALFWEIVRLSENNMQPLSFRTNGAWVLRPPSIDENSNLDISAINDLVEVVFDWSEKWRSKHLETYSIDALLSSLGPLDQLKGQHRTVAICSLSLLKKYQQALDLCPLNTNDAGGFSIRGSETFYTCARVWLEEKISNNQ